ncbi:hypothetical protein LLEC1_02114 [Akanthomyces lecanii]|uniref:Zn(2)-C6 fungal-type domain-containing protein n=1 Tax=Cordyceps confragosa TaxID=2714763 RepID=A0A179I2T5_CORDF|nr:hypothetical protein LLEC1_02114 [Akanthomyces lecanii]
MAQPLTKTCQTCFRAKIKCASTQQSGKCDRCLRLGRGCVFPPSRRKLGASKAATVPRSLEPGADNRDGAASQSPFASGLLSVEAGQALLQAYMSKMSARFPFVVISERSVDELHAKSPALCLAVVTVAAFDNGNLQRRLGHMFNHLVAERVAGGDFASLDLLQAFLVQLAWAHYQPRPLRHTQYLNLAISIVSDLRLDRPKNTNLWMVDRRETQRGEWSADEIRALAGAYYLASSSSVLMQKLRCFPFCPYILEASQALALQQLSPYDKFIPVMVNMQRIIENVDSLATKHKHTGLNQSFAATVEDLRQELSYLKSSVSFPFMENRILHLQAHTAELLLNQCTTSASVFGLEHLGDGQASQTTSAAFLSWLSESILATKSIIDVCQALMPEELPLVTNLEWIVLYCGLSLGTRLDIVAAQPQIRHATKQLRRLSDIKHILRQVVLRMESSSGDATDESLEQVMHGLAKRVKLLQTWHLDRLPQESGEVEADSMRYTPTHLSSGADCDDFTSPPLTSSIGLTPEDLGATDPLLISELLAGLGQDANCGDFSFTLPQTFD